MESRGRFDNLSATAPVLPLLFFTARIPMATTDTSRHLITASWALAVRELRRFFRQRSRLVGAIGQPVVFWIVFGAGLGASFQAPAWADALDRPLTYQEYFLPGIAVLIVLFTAIFATISIIEDRREGFLQGVLVAPASRSAIVLGKVLGGALLAMIQAGLFLCLGPLLSYVGLAPDIPVSISITRGLAAGAFLTIVAIELTALGFLLAWPMNSTQGFHAVMSILLLVGEALPSMFMCSLVTLITTCIVFALCVQLVRRPSVQNTV